MTKTALAAPGVWVLTLPYTSPPLSQNRRMHHMKEHAERKQILQDVGWLARAKKLPTGLSAIHVTLLWRPKQIRRRDSDNPAPTIKACIDALVRHGVVPDDSSRYVSSEAQIVDGRCPAPHGLWLVVYETSGALWQAPPIDASLLR